MSAKDENVSDYAAFRADNKLIFYCPQMSAKYIVRNVCIHYNFIINSLRRKHPFTYTPEKGIELTSKGQQMVDCLRNVYKIKSDK